mgnify:CR=1 FL=1
MSIYEQALNFKRKYPKTIAWRLKAHSKIAQIHLNPNEKVKFVFACQKNSKSYEIFRTYVVVVTDKRIMVAQKRLLFGYFFISVTSDMYNDLTVMMGLLWGKVCIDTVKEVIMLSNIQKEALPEIETAISQSMMEIKIHCARR